MTMLKPLLAKVAPNLKLSTLLRRYKAHFFTLICCFTMLMVVTTATDRAGRIAISSYYLWLAYGLFIALFASKLICMSGHELSKGKNPISWFNRHEISVSVMIGCSLMVVIEESYEVRSNYDWAAILAFGLLSFHVLFYLHERFVKKSALDMTHATDMKTRGYFIYGLFLALNFFNSSPMDYDNPYAPGLHLRIVFWMLMGHFVFSWLLGQFKLIKQLKSERTDAELAHLKSQVNPHFLFNTLNNLYGLALEKSDKTPGLILKLSGMLRYTIYQGKNDFSKLKDEISYLDDYIELQQVRFHKKVDIKFNQSFDGSDHQISPLLLIMLLENAYKHGVEKLTGDAFVNIDLKVKDEQMYFSIKNNYDESEAIGEPGIGLKNLKRRLDLVYPNKHNLTINKQHDVYQVILELDLRE